jgi:hypothetical protein
MNDILYQGRNNNKSDVDITILDPKSENGIEIFTIVGYTPVINVKDVCEGGLKSFNRLKELNPKLKRRTNKYLESDKYHDDYIYFRAPYTNNNKDDNPPTFKELYDGKTYHDIIKNKADYLVSIKVDPEKTYVFHSKYRLSDNPYKDKTLLRDYLDKLKSGDTNGIDKYDMEIVAKIPEIPPEWFVVCHKKSAKNKLNEEENIQRRIRALLSGHKSGNKSGNQSHKKYGGVNKRKTKRRRD